MSDASKIFGAGVTFIPKEVPPIPVEVRKDKNGTAFVIHLRRLPTLETQKIWNRVSKAAEAAQQLEDVEQSLERLIAACKQLTEPRGQNKQKPAVVDKIEGLTLDNFQTLVNDHREYQGDIFDQMRADPTKTFPSSPELIGYLLAQNASVRLLVLTKMSEAVEEEAKKQEGKGEPSESSSA